MIAVVLRSELEENVSMQSLIDDWDLPNVQDMTRNGRVSQ